MGIAGVASLDHDVGIGAQRQAAQVGVHRTHGQRCLNRQLALGQFGIAQHQNYLARLDLRFGFLAQRHDGLLEAGAFRVVAQRQQMAGKCRVVLTHQRSELAWRQHRRGQNQAMGVFRCGLEDIQLRATAGFQRHDDRFAQRVDGRVGDLSKLLPEVVGEQARAARQDRHGRIVAHGSDGLLAAFCQRTQHLVTLFKGHLKHLLLHVQGVGIHGLESRQLGQRRLQVAGFLLQPTLVGVGGLQAVIDVLGVQHFAGVGIHGQHLTGADAAFCHHVFRLIAVGADFRRQRDVAILGDHPARRAQPVTVEHTHGLTAVGHDHASGAIPGLHVHGVVLVERPQLGIHGLHVLPGRWHHHAHGAV